jgi:hypothetical protein
MDRLDLHEQIEIHRDGEGDDPAVAEPLNAVRRDGVKAYDAVVGAAMRQVAVPDGFKSRIRQRVAVESADRQTRRRRTVMIAGVGSALALSLMFGLFVWRWPDKSWTTANVAAEAAKWYGARTTFAEPPKDMPPLQRAGVRNGLVAAFREIPFLKRDALAYRLETGGNEAVAIIVDAHWFPDGFDFADTYVNSTDGTILEVRFRRIDDADQQWCILIGERLKPFEEKTVIL